MKSFNAIVNRGHAVFFETHPLHLILLLVVTASGCGQSDSTKIRNAGHRSERSSAAAITIGDESTGKSSPPPQIRNTTLSVKEIWRIEGLGAPAGLAYDSDANELRLAQIGGEGDAKDGDGVISRVSITGEMLELSWSRGMDAPKDMVLDDNSIWVTDIDRVIEIDRKTGIVCEMIPVPNARFLVGITIDADHRLLLADLLASRISSFKDGEFRVLHEGTELQSPSKMLCTDEGIVVAPWGFTSDFSGNELGNIFCWSPDSRGFKRWSAPMNGHWMGLCPNGAGGWFVADFESGMILQIKKCGVWEMIITLGHGLGAVLYLPTDRLLLAAHITENRLYAFYLNEVVALRKGESVTEQNFTRCNVNPMGRGMYEAEDFRFTLL